jgi:hypothetical protein
MRIFISAVLVALGVAVCWAGITIGHADDAPGVGMIGIVVLLISIFAAFKIWRRR